MADAKTPPYVVDGKMVTVLRGGVGIRVVGDSLAITRQRKAIVAIPAAAVDTLVVQAFGVDFSSQDAWRCAELSIAVLFAAPNGPDVAVMSCPQGPHAAVRRAQSAQKGTGKSRDAAAAMLSAKVGNQALVLKYLARAGRRDGRKNVEQLDQAATGIRELQAKLESAATMPPTDDEIPKWMGFEGSAAALYWQAVRQLLPGELGFEGRCGRGARDPVNQALNFAYGLLYAEVWRAITRVGLDAGIDLLHSAERAGRALVFDLVEELRGPLVDRLVLTLVGRGWRPQTREHDGKVLLTPRDRYVLVEAWKRQKPRALRCGRGKVRVQDLALRQAKALKHSCSASATTTPRFDFGGNDSTHRPSRN